MRSLAAAAAALVLAGTAHAQPAPGKPMRVIVPYAAGGVTDAVTRAVVARVAESLGRPVIVENRPGGGTVIGMQACAKGDPDGSTACVTVPDSLSYGPALMASLPYDVERDFAPVLNLGFTNNLLVANAQAPFGNYREMIGHARASPGAINIGTWGPATIPDVYARWIARQANVSLTSVHYKGSSGTIPAVLSGEVQVTFMGFGTALPHVRSGKLKPVVALGEKRSAYLPTLGTLAEEGVDPGLVSYFGLFAPGATPAPVVEWLNAEFSKAVRTQQVQEFYRSYTVDSALSTPDAFATFTRADRRNAAKVFQSVGIVPGAAQ